MEYLVKFFAWLMEWCHSWCPNYWADIVIFTLLTKVLQFPISLWCQVNSLKMVSLMPQSNRIKMDHYGDSDAIGEETAALFKREKYHPMLSLVPLAIQIVILMAFVKVIYGIGDRLTVPGAAKPLIACVPWTDGGLAWLMPLFAGAAAWLLGYTQNIFNPLQHEQTRTQQIITNGISICISLFLGCFVAAGVGLYWAASNIFSILVQLCENLVIPPKKHVDYHALRRSQAELRKFEDGLKKKAVVSPEDKKREKADYRRFFSVANKHVVFYAEGGGFYKYFAGVIDWLISHTNLTIHYVTNDPHDKVLSSGNPRIRAYYIGPVKIIPLFMKMDADMVVMTTPDLNTYQLKRSYVKKDVEYAYIDHGTSSVSMVFRKGAFDNFDTIFLVGRFQIPEHRRIEELYGLKSKKLVPAGYAYLGDLMRNYVEKPRSAGVQVLIAPSYQKDNILDLCLDDVLSGLRKVEGIKATLRPHPQYVRRFAAKIQAIEEKFKGESWVVLDTDFSKPPALYESDIVVTDWSSISFEFSLVTKRPSILINTPPKVINPDYGKIGIVATDVTFRDRIGVSLDVDKVDTIGDVVNDMVAHPDVFRGRIEDLLDTEFYDPLKSAEASGKYILDTLISKKKGTKK